MLQEPQQADNRTYCNGLCKEIGICVDNDLNCRAYDPEMIKQWEREHHERCEELQRISDARIKIPLQRSIYTVLQANSIKCINSYSARYCNPYRATLCVYNSFYHFPESRTGKPTYYQDDLTFPVRYLEQLGLAESEYDQVVSVNTGEEEMQPYKTFLSSVKIKSTGEVHYSIEGYLASIP